MTFQFTQKDYTSNKKGKLSRMHRKHERWFYNIARKGSRGKNCPRQRIPQGRELTQVFYLCTHSDTFGNPFNKLRQHKSWGVANTIVNWTTIWCIIMASAIMYALGASHIWFMNIFLTSPEKLTGCRNFNYQLRFHPENLEAAESGRATRIHPAYAFFGVRPTRTK